MKYWTQPKHVTKVVEVVVVAIDDVGAAATEVAVAVVVTCDWLDYSSV